MPRSSFTIPVGCLFGARVVESISLNSPDFGYSILEMIGSWTAIGPSAHFTISLEQRRTTQVHAWWGAGVALQTELDD